MTRVKTAERGRLHRRSGAVDVWLGRDSGPGRHRRCYVNNDLFRPSWSFRFDYRFLRVDLALAS